MHIHIHIYNIYIYTLYVCVYIYVYIHNELQIQFLGCLPSPNHSPVCDQKTVIAILSAPCRAPWPKKGDLHRYRGGG
jgi:hypothetical protein